METAAIPDARGRLGGRRVRRVVDHAVLSEADAWPERGLWAVVGDFEGEVHAWRFAEVEAVASASEAGAEPRPEWHGPQPGDWVSSLDRPSYLGGVAAVRAAIREGDVYQVNLCRVLSARLPVTAARDGGEPDASGLAARLMTGNPAPFAGWVHVPAGTRTPDGRHVPPAWVVTASPELFLRVDDGIVTSGPIKGTAATAAGLTAKDEAENVMIVDMVRNDLQRICEPGTVEVTALLAVEQHPGLVHLVSTVAGRLVDPATPWRRLLAAGYPPASVSGAPKHAALDVIHRLEPGPRGPYCGAVGWLDADAGRAELAVGIRTFWWTPGSDGAGDGAGTLHFGTGAGITWGSDPEAEWAETELKAARLVALASD